MMVAKATELAEQQADGLKETFLEYIKRDVADLIQKLLAMIISGAKLGK